MTPKEKAIDLVDKFSERTKFFDEYEGWLIRVDSSKAKGYALVAVDEIIKAREVVPEGLIFDRAYWLDVKDEIESK
jgi:hypothetical protein